MIRTAVGAGRSPIFYRFCAGILVLLMLPALGCAPSRAGKRGAQTPAGPPPQRIWPGPPDTPRFVYEAELRSLADIRPEREDERFRRLMTGQEAANDLAYHRPSALLARHGRVFIADPQGRSVVVFDIPRQRLIRFGTRPPNEVRGPRALAMDDAHRVYVLDDARKAVMVFDALGLFLYSVGDAGHLSKPVGLAVSPDGQKIYVVDRGSLWGADHRVQVFSPDNRLLKTIGPRGRGPGELDVPLDAVVTSGGSLAVLDAGNFRVQLFDRDGQFIRSFGSAGNQLGQFSRPRGITADASGRLYVSDGLFNNVQVFDEAGVLLMVLGKADVRTGPGRFALIGAMAFDETGRFYVADEFHRKIEVYKPVPATSVLTTGKG